VVQFDFVKRTHLIVALFVGLALGLSVTVGLARYFMRKQDAESPAVRNASSEIDPIDAGTGGAAGAGAGNNARAAKFEALDVDKDGILSFSEFAGRRKPNEAEKWFKLRDGNNDGFISREEFLPFSATPRAR
jgi:hypothetical protein